MTTFKLGDRCRAVEYDENCSPGKSYPAEVVIAGSHYATARVSLGSGTALWAFDQGAGWGATRALRRWRLVQGNTWCSPSVESFQRRGR